MPTNYVLLETIELTQSAASVTFDNIPQTGYTDLIIKASTRSNWSSTGNWAYLYFNGSTSGYTNKGLYGDGSGTGSLSLTNQSNLDNAATSTSNTFSNCEIYIPNYTSSNHKSFSSDSVTENNATQAYCYMWSGLWANTAAITSVTLYTEPTALFTQHTSFSLYGVAALSTNPTFGPKATGGNIVANDGTYWYHAFLSSGMFTPITASLSCDAIIVAGGGGGLWGGGGAGGFRSTTSQNLVIDTNYIAIIGSGGPINYGYSGENGNNSSFSGTGITTITSTGGGGGGSTGTIPGKSGGSGGGGGNDSPFTGGAGNLGSYSPAEGFAGGSGNGSGGAGGGGATGAGGNYNAPATGGPGNSSYSSWGLATNTGQNVSGTYWYAGGGGGGNPGANGGNGGGGTGSPSSSTSGMKNTGGGGGGGWNTAGKEGGSGIVIIRYAMA